MNIHKLIKIDELIKKDNPNIDIIKGFDIVDDNLIYHYKYTVIIDLDKLIDVVLFHIPNLDIVAIASGDVDGVIKYKGYFKYSDSKQSLLRTDFDNISFKYSDILNHIEQFERNEKLEELLKYFGV